jgi:hypothetical protein
MKRLAVATAAIAMFVAVPFVGIANAAPSNITSVTLSCDKNVDATVTLALQPSQTDTTWLGDMTISCGPDSNVGRARNRADLQTGAYAAGWVVIKAWTNSTGQLGACPTGGALTYKATNANSAGIGSQLVVR